jgi:putative hydrolase
MPGGMGNFLQGMLGDMLRLLRTDSPLQWELALQLAHSIAAEDGGDANPEPVQRISIEELARIAELQVADVSGLMLTSDGRPLQIIVTGRTEWARRTLEAWRPLLEELAGALSPPVTPPSPVTDASLDPDGEEDAQFSNLLGQWATVFAPAMTAMQIGSIVGHLAQRSLGSYDLPIPRRNEHELVVIAHNATAFAEAWSLPEADVRLWCLVHDLAVHAVLARPHVRERLGQLLVERARGLTIDPTRLEDRIGELGPAALGDMGELSRLFGDPAALSELQDTPELRRTQSELDCLLAVILGFAAYVTATVAARVIGAGVPIGEAMRRAAMERGDEARGGETMLGLNLDSDAVDKGERFVRGILDRGGESELARLFTVAEHLPTPAELEAPGLWIERTHLADTDEGA